MGTVDHEGVCFSAADNSAGVCDHLANFETDASEDFVTVGVAESFIDHTEMVDVDDDGVHFHGFMVLIEKLCIVVEEFTVVEIGKGIAFGGLDGETILKELDGAADTCKDHAGCGVGFGDEVRCTEGEGFDL